MEFREFGVQQDTVIISGSFSLTNICYILLALVQTLANLAELVSPNSLMHVLKFNNDLSC